MIAKAIDFPTPDVSRKIPFIQLLFAIENRFVQINFDSLPVALL